VSQRRVAVLLTFISFVAIGAQAQDWRKTYSVSAKPEIRVDANDADIRVYTADRKDIEAVVTTNGYKIGSGGVSISDHQTGDRVEINIHVPNVHLFSFGWHKSVHVQLNIPREADLDLHSGDGRITAENLNGKATLRSGDGDIQITSGKGAFNIETGDGRVECQNIEGDLHAETKDGGVRIDGVFTTLDLHTGDGSIDAEARPGSKMTSGWSVRTGDGSVTLRLPDGFPADLDVHTGDGHITMDFPVTIESGASLKQNAIRGKMNGGGQVLEIKTGDGNITLRRG
jgi:DUF4097 and DUF4098 domain-containing protein YvlB